MLTSIISKHIADSFETKASEQLIEKVYVIIRKIEFLN